MEKKQIAIELDVLEELEKLCSNHDVNRDGLFKRLVLYPNLTEQLLEFPDKITDDLLIDVNTVMSLLPEWLQNIRENFKLVKEGNDIKILPEGNRTPALIIGAGPTLYRNKHLELLAKKGFTGQIFATDAVLKDCLEAGIIPDYVTFTDASPKILKFIDHNIIDEYADKLKAIMNIHMHPSVVNRWKGDIYWYQSYIDDFIAPNLKFILFELTHKAILIGGGQTASIGWALAALKNYNPIILIGLDLSYPMDMDIRGTRLVEHYLSFFNNMEDVLKIFDKTYHHKFFNTDCKFEIRFDNYTFIAKKHLKWLKDAGFQIINCTEGGTLEGEGIECMWFKDYLDSQ